LECTGRIFIKINKDLNTVFKKESKINLYRITEIIILLVISQIARGQDNFLKSRQVAPGVIHYHDYRQEGPWHIHVIEIDRKNPWIRLETVKAGNKLTERDKTSVMISRYDTVRHHVVCAINGDFYEGNGVPVGAQVSKGILLKKPTTRSVFGVSENGIPFIDIVSFEGSIWTLDGTQLTVDGINENQSDSTLIIYNPYFGERTQTEPPCLKILCEYLADNNFVNDTSYVQVLEMDSISAFHELKRQDLIISIGQNKKSQLAGSLHLGDTLAVLLNLIPAEFRISELIGGTPRLIRDGAVSVEWEKENDGKSFTYNRHPRTAVGISADSMRIFFVTVDGRQKGYSAGMSLFELAEYMQSWGIKQAVNLDGGGSTTMVVRGNIVNSPSDLEGERAVSSALMVVSTAPLGLITRLQIEPEMIKMLKNMPVNFSVTGYDQYFNPHRLETDKIGWSCDPNIGYIDQNGRFISGNKKVIR
jgi:exopolysaccharide biosynthesis protein